MRSNALVIFLAVAFDALMGQGKPVAKTVDTVHNSVVAVLRLDSSGRSWVNGSGVLIHPRVVLTAGHVRFNGMGREPGGCVRQGFVAFGENAYETRDRYPFDWLTDIESHPDTAEFQKSFSDTTGRTRPSMFVDIGLVFLPKPVDKKTTARLPDPHALTHTKTQESLVGVGFGYHKTYDSTFVNDLVDGLRRQWRLLNLSLINDLWLSTQCDTTTNLPFISMFDSGGPLFLDDDVVVGIWSMFGKADKPCLYSSWAVRIDSPEVLSWIKDRAKARLGVSLN